MGQGTEREEREGGEGRTGGKKKKGREGSPQILWITRGRDPGPPAARPAHTGRPAAGRARRVQREQGVRAPASTRRARGASSTATGAGRRPGAGAGGVGASAGAGVTGPGVTASAGAPSGAGRRSTSSSSRRSRGRSLAFRTWGTFKTFSPLCPLRGAVVPRGTPHDRGRRVRLPPLRGRRNQPVWH